MKKNQTIFSHALAWTLLLTAGLSAAEMVSERKLDDTRKILVTRKEIRTPAPPDEIKGGGYIAPERMYEYKVSLGIADKPELTLFSLQVGDLGERAPSGATGSAPLFQILATSVEKNTCVVVYKQGFGLFAQIVNIADTAKAIPLAIEEAQLLVDVSVAQIMHAAISGTLEGKDLRLTFSSDNQSDKKHEFVVSDGEKRKWKQSGNP